VKMPGVRPKVSLAATLAVVAAIATMTALGADAGRTINDHVFSSAQAQRGQQAFRQNCATGCHMTDMTGSERAPGLAGDSFMLRWNGQTLGDLFARIQQTMPQTAPHSLSDQTYVDIVGYILSANGLPSGSSELKSDLDSLKAIKFVYVPDSP
jgi:S-disulfanyl-L-cysteine oxidoreductase SoxD